jgi:hypothetical protein
MLILITSGITNPLENYSLDFEIKIVIYIKSWRTWGYVWSAI